MRPRALPIYSGDDGTAVALMLLGGQGNVSVTANVAPRLMHELCMAAIEGDVKRATQHAPAAAAAAQAAVLRTQPGAGQVGDVAAGPVRRPRCACRSLPLTPAGQALVGQACATPGC
jgi:4-hydroxy-tetrahydrodipicolinate synthase